LSGKEGIEGLCLDIFQRFVDASPICSQGMGRGIFVPVAVVPLLSWWPSRAKGELEMDPGCPVEYL